MWARSAAGVGDLLRRGGALPAALAADNDGAMPLATGFVPPCIPTRAYRVPSGPDWVHEIKHDGYRLQVRRDGDVMRLFMGLEGIVSKRLSAPYRSGPSRDWPKIKNPDSPAMIRARKADWS
jgi:ATP-dependent DNA ligase